MEIRRAAEEDIPEIIRLLEQVRQVHHRGRPDLFRDTGTKYTAEELAGLLQEEARPVFVALDEAGAVLGYAFCILTENRNHPVMQDLKTLYIDDICVDEQARGRHVGKRLYERVAEEARRRGCYNVTLNVWACNPGAIEFYKSLGMQPQKLGMEAILENEQFS